MIGFKRYSAVFAVWISFAGNAGAADQATDQEKAETGSTIYQDSKGGEASKDWKDYLTDEAAGSVSAAGMLGISGESITNVENVRDILVSLKGLSSDDSKGTLAVAVTPGRSDFSPISQDAYFQNVLARLAANTTLGYAQGDTDIVDVKFERQAASVETSLFLSPLQDDPVFALPQRLYKDTGTKRECDLLPADATPEASSGDAGAPQQDGGGAQAPGRNNDGQQVPTNREELEAAAATAEEIQEAFPPKRLEGAALEARRKIVASCVEAMKKDLRWNRSRFSLAYATGWIKAKSGPGKEESMGHTAVASLSYGYRKAILASVTYRHTWDEPVLTTLAAGPLQEKDSSLVVVRLVGGSNRLRGFVEISDAHSDDVTASQRTFKQALGLDVRLRESTWINLRVGKQRSVGGTEDETGSLVTLSYSPTELLKTGP